MLEVLLELEIDKTLFLIANIILLYIFLIPVRSRWFQVVVYVGTWIIGFFVDYILASISINHVLISYIVGFLYLIPTLLVFKESFQAKVFVFFMNFSLTQLIFVIFVYIDHFLALALPQSFVLVGLVLELIALPIVNKYMKIPVKNIIEILDCNTTIFTLFPLLSFLLLTCYSFQKTYLLSIFMTLVISTVIILFSYYLIAASISATKRLKKLEVISITDSLTGLYNRRFLEEKIEEEYNRYQKTGAKFALIIGDIDFFKNINDLYGHDCGDTVLKLITKDMQSAIRTYDTVARWGGEEFLFLLPSTSNEKAITVAERIRKSVQERKYQFPNCEKLVTVTVSLGVSVVGFDDTIDNVIKKADMALYYGKQKSRNCVLSFNDIKKDIDL